MLSYNRNYVNYFKTVWNISQIHLLYSASENIYSNVHVNICISDDAAFVFKIYIIPNVMLMKSLRSWCHKIIFCHISSKIKSLTLFFTYCVLQCSIRWFSGKLWYLYHHPFKLWIKGSTYTDTYPHTQINNR